MIAWSEHNRAVCTCSNTCIGECRKVDTRGFNENLPPPYPLGNRHERRRQAALERRKRKVY